MAQWYQKNKAKHALSCKHYQHENKEKIAESQKKKYQRSKAEVCAQKKVYYQVNKKELNARQTQRNRLRRQNNPTYKLICNLRRRLHTALSGQCKTAESLNLLGGAPEDLRKHLEEQFTDGMSWENYGMRGWHVDHIKPCAKFDLTKEAEQRRCFHYSNLQPLWAADNLAKGDNYNE